MGTQLKQRAELGLLLFVILAAVLVYYYVTEPALREVVSPYHCLFYRITGMLCPACGGTRAMIHLLDGRFLLALKSNALAVLALPLVVYGMVVVFRLAFDSRFGTGDVWIAPALLWSMPVIVVIFWIIRNIPGCAILRPLY